LRFRNVLLGVGAKSCSCTFSSASVDCGRDIEMEARTGFAASEAGFGACVLRFLRTRVSSDCVTIPLLDPLPGMSSDEETLDSGTFSNDVVDGGAFSTAADFLFALIIGLGFGTAPDALISEGIVVDPLLVV